ncbi:MAG: hypothetical protein DMG17_16730 [Acidobacteria bacterium]|nr:MAG: hypothetical protein DMG17_16730 [Acidobacteriota bacterium]
MTVFALAFVIGVLNGLRSFTPPAAAAWAAHLRWINLHGPLALIGSVPAVAIFTLLAVFELFADKMPWIPDRITTMSLVARGVMGALTGACVAAGGGLRADIGAACGIAGGIAGAFAGYYARRRSVKALGVPDFYVALVEDLICIAGALWVVTRFQ